MNQSPGALRHTHYAPVLTLFLSIFLGLNLTLKAQPTWPPSSWPALADDNIGNSPNPHWVNMDMHQYHVAGNNPPYYYGVVVYDDQDNNIVYIVSFDSKLGTDVRTILDAKYPDVMVFTETTCTGFPACSSPYYTDCSKFGAWVVYEDANSGEIKLNRYDMGVVGSTFTPLTVPTTYTVSNPLNPATCPHIDGSTDDNLYTCNTSYNAMNRFVITWTENNSGTNEIYARYGGYMATVWPFNTGSTQFIDYGEMSDIALTYDWTTTNIQANFVYYDGAGTVMHADWDPATTTVNNTVLESGISAVTAPPRIDALNIDDIVSVGTHWQAVAEVLDAGSGVHEIHGYDNTAGVLNVTNYSSLSYMTGNPLVSNEAYGPAVAVGIGPNAPSLPPSGSGYIGNAGYTVGWNIDNYELHPIWQDATDITAILGGYEQINNTSFSGSTYGPGKNLLALSNCTNTGNYLGSAWYNPDDQNVYMKVITGVSFAFKPTGLSDVNAETGISLSPNPAHNVLNLSTAVKGAYSITDIAGRVLLSGTLKGTEIDISSLSAGLYLLQIDRHGSTGKLKFVKQ